MRFRDRVTFQAPTEVRTDSGGVSYTYANITALTDLPARVIPVIEEERGERMVTTTDLYEIIVQGNQPIEANMAALTTEGVFDVLRVANPPHDWPATLATIVMAERVAI
jgi:hypothetical protein